MFGITPADLDPAFAAACRSGDFAGVLRQPLPRVFALRLVSQGWLMRLGAEVERLRRLAVARGDATRTPNSMHLHGAILDDLGLGDVLDGLLTLCVEPLWAWCYRELGGARLGPRHGYVVAYGKEGDLDLAMHVDDSDVTLNLCLSGPFAGSELRFLGLRCPRHRQAPWNADEEVALAQEPGVAILHLGAHRHAVDPIVSGSRRSLILWCKQAPGAAPVDVSAVCAPCRQGVSV